LAIQKRTLPLIECHSCLAAFSPEALEQLPKASECGHRQPSGSWIAKPCKYCMVTSTRPRAKHVDFCFCLPDLQSPQ
jgi:hypothetical protein